MSEPRPAPVSADPKPARRGRPKAEEGAVSTRARILEAAERLFAEEGFSTVTMPMIAQAAGITAGAIYKHFEGKADLFFHVVKAAVASTPVEPPAEGAPGAGVPETVASFTSARLKRVRQMAVEAHYASARDANVRRLLRQSLDRQMGELAGAVAQGQGVGDFEAGLDPEMMAAAVFVVILGLMHMETLLPDRVDDPAWRAFIASRVAAMLGMASGRKG